MSRYDLRDPDFLRDPAPVLARMRAEGALVQTRLPLIGRTWLTTSDAAARKLLKDPRFVRDPKTAGGKPMEKRFWWMPRFMRPLMQSIILKDGEDHRRIRTVVDHAFNRAPIDAMRPRLAAIADQLLNRIDTTAPVDIVAAYARELPLMAICELLGVPEADRARIARWISPISGPTGLLSALIALPGLWRLMAYFRTEFARARTEDRPGLIRELVLAEAEGHRLSENELLSLVFILFVAGHETTVYLISDAIVSICGNTDLRARIATDPDCLPLAVEEFMRFWSPVMMTKSNFAMEDMTFEGIPVKKGDQVSALLLAANHDPARVEDPATLDPARRPNAHLGFGFGPHVCLGMQLARAEAHVALERLLTRFPDLCLAETPAFTRRLGMRGFKAVNLRLEP